MDMRDRGTVGARVEGFAVGCVGWRWMGMDGDGDGDGDGMGMKMDEVEDEEGVDANGW